MKKILGYIQGNMKKEHIETSDRDIEIINSLPNPPLIPVKKEDIIIRRCRLASDAVDCSHGKFRTENLPMLLDLVQGISMIIGHKKDTVGIARFFNGSIERVEDVFNPFTKKNEVITYIVPKFYWMKKHSKAEDLQVNIDGGIYHQVSLSWWYNKATCGICGKDMRECEHIPGRKYGNTTAFYYYDKIGEVLEGSIVYKGGQPYTGFYLNDEFAEGIEESKKIFAGFSANKSKSRIFSEDIINYLKPLKGKAYITGDLSEKGYSDDKIDIVIGTVSKDEIIDLLPLPFKNKMNFIKSNEEKIKGLEVGNVDIGELPESDENLKVVRKINNVHYLKKDFITFTGRYIIEPLYQGISVKVQKDKKAVKIIDPFKNDITLKIPQIVDDIKSFNMENVILDGILLAYHGRTRMSHKEICDVIYGDKKSKELRIKLMVCDFLRFDSFESENIPLIERHEMLSEFICDTKNIRIIKAELAERPTEIISNIEKCSTKDGAVVKDAVSKYSETDKWFKYKKRFEIDAKIIDCKVTDNGSEYKFGVIGEKDLEIVGSVFSKNIDASEGDIVRLEFEKAELENDEIKLNSPKIVEIRCDKNNPDNINGLKKISKISRNSEKNQEAGCEFMAYEYNEGNERFFELFVQNNSDIGFMKFSRKGDFLFKENCMSLTKKEDSYGCIPSDCKILDYGYVFNLKDEKYLKKFSLFGKYGIIKGNFIAREIMYQRESSFLLWKVDF